MILSWLACAEPEIPTEGERASCESGPSRGPGTTEWCTFAEGRRYLVYTPAGEDLPLVLDLHGGGGLDPPEIHSRISGFAEVAEESADRFVVAWPEGSRGGAEWTTCDYAGPNCPRAAGSVPGLTVDQPDDRAFLLAVIDDLLATRDLDPDRVYATGLSSGGAMAEVLACTTDVLAGIAPLAIGIDAAGQPKAVDNYALSPGCAPSRPIPVLQAHAPTDQVVPYAEGEDGAAFWRSTFGCGEPAPSASLEFDGDEGGDDPTTCGSAACDGGVEVASCTIDASAMGALTFGGHLIYAGDDVRNELVPTPGAAGPRLAGEIWDFLR